MKTLKNEKGFTLIELVLVIIVLGILGAVATIQFGTIVKDSRSAAVDGAFAPYSASLAVAVNTLKALPNAVADGGVGRCATPPANSFEEQVFCKTTMSGNGVVISPDLTLAGAAATQSNSFTITAGACVGTVTYVGGITGNGTGALTMTKGAGC